MKSRKILGLLLSAAFAVTVAARPLGAVPLERKACCGPSCPASEDQNLPGCCRLEPASAPLSVAAAPALAQLVVAAVGTVEVLDSASAVFVLRTGSDRSPPQPNRLSASGLSPPRLA